MRLLLIAASLLLAGSVCAQSSTSYQFERPASTAAATLRVITAQGKVIERQYEAGQSVAFGAQLADGSVLADGTHRWELVFAPQVSASSRAAALVARQAGNDQLPANWPDAIPTRSGLFYVRDGRFQPMLTDEPRPTATGKRDDGTTDQVIAEDLIVQGGGCFGFDCVDNENFGSDIIRLKENNTRIGFDDTSTGSFPANDWQLVANDSASGGASSFSILDVTGARTPFLVTAGAATNSIFVDSTGRVGFRTSTPVLDLHVVTGNTPALRLDQSGAGGFTPQIWDVAGNEANFFVRDATNGSRLPLRIRPGAPTSSIDISADGDVGMGTASPGAALNIARGADPAVEPWLLIRRADDGNAATEERRLELDKDGNLFVSGSITQLSSRTSKTNFITLSGDEVLSRLSDLPIWTWNYLTADTGDRHIGPVAEDFYAAFGFGRSERSLAPGDVAGVALAATKALQTEIAQRDQRIADLEARLTRLEAALERAGDNTQAPR